MKLAVIGSGGREHALVKKLKENPKITQLICIPGNGGIAADAQCVPIAATDVAAVVAYAQEQALDFVVVAPDDPLALGMVDALQDVGIACFGPRQAAARIESSKVFAKDLMQKYHIPTAKYKSFTDIETAKDYLKESCDYPIVIKADGLALGKGVLICEDESQAHRALVEMLEEQRFGASGTRVVIEEFLQGPEVSVLAFCDGKTLVPMCSGMDHKRAHDGDAGLNTGGMGVVAPNPYYTKEIAATCMEQIFLPTLRAMEQEGCPFQGCLYFGLMLTADGPKVIEYNCRFGDPEAQAVLPLLESDLLDILLACSEGRLTPELVRFSKQSSACVIVASGGYPEQYQKGYEIHGLEQIQDANVFFSGVAQQGEALVNAGGRVLGVTAIADTLSDAIALAYKNVQHIHFIDSFYRTDIGKRALEAEDGK